MIDSTRAGKRRPDHPTKLPPTGTQFEEVDSMPDIPGIDINTDMNLQTTP